MDYMEKITELRASKAKLNEQAQALVKEGKFEIGRASCRERV